MNYAERAKTFENIVGKEIDRLNNDIIEMEKAKDCQRMQILQYDSWLIRKIEEVKENEALIERLQNALQVIENDPEADILRDELIKMENLKDSLIFQRNLYDAQLRIEIEKRRENTTEIEEWKKKKEALECDIKTKEDNIKEIESDKEAFKAALSYIQNQQVFSNSEMFEKTRSIQTKLITEQERNKELEENVLNLQEEIRRIENKNKEELQEIRQQLEIRMKELNSLLQKQKEDIEKHWKNEVEKAIKQQEEEQKIVCEQRDRMIEKVQELNSALQKTENEAKTISDLCDKFRCKIDELENILEQQSREVKMHSDANFKQAETIKKLADRLNNDISLSGENLKLAGKVRILETTLKEKLDDQRKQCEANIKLSETVGSLEASLNEKNISTNILEAKLAEQEETINRLNQELQAKNVGSITTDTEVQTDASTGETKVRNTYTSNSLSKVTFFALSC